MFKFIISALYLLLYLILTLPLELVLFIIGKLNMPLRDKISFLFVKYIGLGVVTKMSGSRVIVNGLENIPDDTLGVDIGEKTIELFTNAIKESKTVIWNGPMGVFEMPNYAKGTEAIAKTMAEIDAVTIIGGGDSAAAVDQMGYGEKMTHVSTGGGASLEFLSGVDLPGVSAVDEK